MSGSSRSITQHPLFPALVTVWFGATFGLCSLVIGKPTLEAWVVASGLPDYLSAARPPLGSTARVLLALAACGAGSLLGLLLAAMWVRAKAPDDAAALPPSPQIDEKFEPAEPAPALSVADPEPEPSNDPASEERVPEERAAIIEAEAEDHAVPEPGLAPPPEAETDPLAQFLRRDPTDAMNHAPRAPFSVFDELGPDDGIAAGELSTPEPESEAADHADGATEATIEAATGAQDDFADDPAPGFAGSPPLPSNVHAIDAARLAQRGLATRFAGEAEPAEGEPEPREEAAAPAATTAATPSPAIDHDDLSELSYVQLTERLAKAIARNPQPPANLRRRAATGGASTAVNSPGLERLREVHARTAPANESTVPDADELREALSDLRNMGGAA